MKIKIITETTGKIEAKLTDENPITAKKIWDALPIESQTNIWGDEIYFRIPVEAKQENARAIVEMGDVAFWPPGNAFCVFFGRTPASIGDEIRPASPVNVFGKVQGELDLFKKIKSGERIRVQRA